MMNGGFVQAKIQGVAVVQLAEDRLAGRYGFTLANCLRLNNLDWTTLNVIFAKKKKRKTVHNVHNENRLNVPFFCNPQLF